MKKLICCILILSLFTFSSCKKRIYHFQLNQDISEVVSVQIVDCKDAYNHEVVKEVDLSMVETICAEIESLDMYGIGPDYPPCFGYAIKIMFKNNEFDLICRTGPSHYLYTETHKGVVLGRHAFFRKIDDNQFEEIINKYLK